MDADRYHQIQELFTKACELPPDKRPAFLQTECSDSEIRAKVEDMLRADEASLQLTAPELTPLRQQAFAHLRNHDDQKPPGQVTLPTIPGFTIREKLGEGGMGVVWRAVQQSTNREVAVKTLSIRSTGSARSRLRFDREIELLAGLDHPNIAAVFESGESEGTAWYAMELVDGVDLEAFVEERGLDQSDILELMSVVCEAVSHAHQRGILHRDLKPSNILVDQTGVPHVLDFGLARALDDPSQLTLSMDGQLLGTPAFMSPEQAAGTASQINTRSDVYSLGVILYRLLTKHSPHDTDGSYLTVIRRIAEEDARAPRTLSPALHRDLEAILLHALKRDPEQRYASASEFAADLKNYLNGDPLTARTPTLSYLLRRKLWKHRAALLIVSLILLGIVGGLTQYIRDIQAEQLRTQNAMDDADRHALNATMMSVQTSFQYGLSLCERGDVRQGLMHLLHALRQIPDEEGEELRTAIEANISAWEHRFWRRRLTMQHGSITNDVRFSRDGKRLLIANELGVQIRDVLTGKQIGKTLQHTAFTVPYQIWGVDEHPHTHIVAMSSSGGIAQLRDPSSGRMLHQLNHAATSKKQRGRTTAPESRLTETDNLIDSAIRSMGHSTDVWCARFSPTGELIATGAADGVVWIWNTETGQPEGEPLLHKSAVHDLAFSPDGNVVAVATGNSLQFWNLTTRDATGDLIKVGSLRTLSVEFNSNGNRAITASLDGSVREWNVAERKQVGDTLTLSDGVPKAIYSLDDEAIYTLVRSGEFRAWSSETHQPLGDPGIFYGEGRAMALNPASGNVAVGDASRLVRISSPPQGMDSLSVKAGFQISSAQFSAKPGFAWVQSKARRLWLWEIARKPAKLVSRINPGSTVTRMRLAPDRRRIALALDFKLVIFDAEVGTPVSPEMIHDEFLKNPESINSIAWNQDGSVIATATDEHVRIWSAKDGRLVGRHAFSTAPADLFTMSASECVITAVGKELQSWSWKSDTSNSLVIVEDQILCLSASCDGTMVLAGCRDGLAYLWRYGQWETSVQKFHHDHAVTAVSFVPESTLIVTGTHKGEVRCWDRMSGHPVGPVNHHDQSITCIDTAPTAHCFITGSHDKTGRIWQLPQIEPLPSLNTLTQELESVTELTIDDSGTLHRKASLAIE